MKAIDWSAVIASLVASGMTQPQIAEACKCGQSTVSDMLNRRTTDPRASLAFKLLGMLRDRGLPEPATSDIADARTPDQSETQHAA